MNNNYVNSLRLVTQLFSQLGNTPLHLAIYYDRSKVVELLLSQAIVNIKNNVSSVSTISSVS